MTLNSAFNPTFGIIASKHPDGQYLTSMSHWWLNEDLTGPAGTATENDSCLSG